MVQTFNISIFTENTVGMLNRITIIFTRRHINIESITASESEIKGIHRYTIVVNVELDLVKKVVAQIEKQIEVVKAFYHTDEDVIYQELALFKLPTEIFIQEGGVERTIRAHNIRINPYKWVDEIISQNQSRVSCCCEVIVKFGLNV